MDGRWTHYWDPQQPLHFLNTLIPSNKSSPSQNSPSYQYPEQTINLELFINATIQREDTAITVTMIGGNPVAFAKYCFINYLCQQVLWHEWDLEQKQWWAQARIQWLLAQQSTTPLYHWIIYRITCLHHSQQSTPYHFSGTSTSSSNSSQPLPIPPPLIQRPTPHIPIQTSPTVTEAWHQQWRQDFLHEELPEDSVEGSQENPIVIDITDFEDWFRASISLGEVMLQFFLMFPLLSSCLHHVPITCFITASWYLSYPFSLF